MKIAYLMFSPNEHKWGIQGLAKSLAPGCVNAADNAWEK